MMLILLISYYGLYLPFVSFEFSSEDFDVYSLKSNYITGTPKLGPLGSK